MMLIQFPLFSLQQINAELKEPLFHINTTECFVFVCVFFILLWFILPWHSRLRHSVVSDWELFNDNRFHFAKVTLV